MRGVDLLTLPADRMLNVVYASVVQDTNGFVAYSEVREEVDRVLNEVSLADADPDEWGMSEEDEAAMVSWASNLPSPTEPDVQH